MSESPAPRFWICVFCQDTCKPSFDDVVSKNVQSGMKVVYGVSEGDVICIIQIREMIIAQREADGTGNMSHDPINCMAEQSRGENATISPLFYHESGKIILAVLEL